MSMKMYGEISIKKFNVKKDFEIWKNGNKNNFTIKITLPEFICLCPRSGYPDFATIYVEYMPDNYLVELKTMKLYINTFKDRYISHEDSVNEIYNLLDEKLHPKYLKIIADFNPRGNVHTVIEIDSKIVKEKENF